MSFREILDLLVRAVAAWAKLMIIFILLIVITILFLRFLLWAV